jgi:hypothetical protein
VAVNDLTGWKRYSPACYQEVSIQQRHVVIILRNDWNQVFEKKIAAEVPPGSLRVRVGNALSYTDDWLYGGSAGPKCDLFGPVERSKSEKVPEPFVGRKRSEDPPAHLLLPREFKSFGRNCMSAK